MLVYLEPWMLQDGQIPRLGAGDVLREVGLRAVCWRACRSAGIDAWRPGDAPALDNGAQHRDAGPHPHAAHMDMDGEMVWRRDDPEAGVLRVGGDVVLVEGRYESVGSPLSMNFRVKPVGMPREHERVRLQGSLRVMHKFEHQRFVNAPDVRADWLVRSVHVERCRSAPDEVDGATPLRESIRRTDPWEDDGLYLLDLVAATR